jgi:hypothetical protein
MWQFCTAIGKGNHDNTPYNVLCCGEPLNFPSQLHRLSRFRRHNPYSTINFSFGVKFDPTAAWWPLLPGSQVVTSTPIVFTYNYQTTVPAALFTTMEQPIMDPTPENLQSWTKPSTPAPLRLKTVLKPLAEKNSSSSRSRLKAINWSPTTSAWVEDCVTNPARKEHHNSETNPVRIDSRKVHKTVTFDSAHDAAPNIDTGPLVC